MRKPGIEGPGKARAKTGWDTRKVSGHGSEWPDKHMCARTHKCHETPRPTNTKRQGSRASPTEHPRGKEEKKQARAGCKASQKKKRLAVLNARSRGAS